MQLVGIHHVGIKVSTSQNWHLWASYFLQFNRLSRTEPNLHAKLAPTLLINPYGGGGIGLVDTLEPIVYTDTAQHKGWIGIQLRGFNPVLIQSMLKTDHIPSEMATHASGRNCITAEDALGIIWQFLETPIQYKQRNLANGGVLGVQLKTHQPHETATWWQSLFENVQMAEIKPTDVANALRTDNTDKHWLLSSKPTKTAMQTVWQPCQIEIIQPTEKVTMTKTERIPYVAFEVCDVHKLHQLLVSERHTDKTLQHYHTQEGLAIDYFFTHDPAGNAVVFCQTRQIPLLPQKRWLLALDKRKKPVRQWHKNLLYASLQKLIPTSR